mgnify:CR=1 FL=1
MKLRQAVKEGFGYFLLAAILWGVAEILSLMPQQFDHKFINPIINYAISATEGLAVVLLIVGGATVFIVESTEILWGKKLEPAIKAGFKNIADSVSFGNSSLTPEIISNWLDNRNVDKESIKSVAIKATKISCGSNEANEHNLTEYIFENFFDKYIKPDSIMRSGFKTNIKLSKFDSFHHDQNDFVFKWEEDKNYEIKTKQGKCEHEIKSSNESKIFPQYLEKALGEIELRIEEKGADFDKRKKELFVLSKILDSKTISEIIEHHKAEGDNWSIKYDGLWLNVEVTKNVEVGISGKNIYINEISFLSSTDRMYLFSSHMPTHNFRIDLELGDGLQNWKLNKPTVTAGEYHKEATEHVEILKNAENKITVHIPGWILPGIASVIEWGEKHNPS